MSQNQVKFRDLVFDRNHFYLMHMNYENRDKEEELWNFAKNNEMIGLDSIVVKNDWPKIRKTAIKSLNNPWPLQFDMICENMHEKSMVEGDIVVVMSGCDFVLGIGRVSGPHKYMPKYFGLFFDHTRPMKWEIAYEFANRLKVPRVFGFNNTLSYVTKRQDEFSRWQQFMKLSFPRGTIQSREEQKAVGFWVIKKSGEKEILDKLIAGEVTWRVGDYTLKYGGTRRAPNINSIKPKDRFLVYFSEGKKSVFCATGILAAKFTFSTRHQLGFYNASGHVGFNVLPKEVNYDEIKDRIDWKPVEGNIQSISREDFLAVLEKAGADPNWYFEPEFAEEIRAEEDTSSQPIDEPPPDDRTPLEQVSYPSIDEHRDTKRVKWVKNSYAYNCQICLSKEDPIVLNASNSYAEIKINRKLMIQGHHIKEIKKDLGHDHVGNILSLCIYHHLHCLHPSPYKESLLDLLGRSLGNAKEKEIIWSKENVTKGIIVRTGEKLKDGTPLNIVFKESHLHELKKYLDYLESKKG